MKLHAASPAMCGEIRDVIHSAVRTVYPRYYPAAVVDFFLQHHSLEKVRASVAAGNVYVLTDNGSVAATGAVGAGHIEALYVLPEMQGQGLGSRMMDFLENKAAAEYDHVLIDASLPAVQMYEHRGYRTLRHDAIDLPGGARLVFEVMRKDLEKTGVSPRQRENELR